MREAEGFTKAGEIGALLRREGLYASLLTTWRRELRAHGVEELAAKRRGPAPRPKPSAREVELERANRKLVKHIAKAKVIIEFQKNGKSCGTSGACDGVIADGQCWFRDPAAPGTTNLSNAIQWTCCT